MIKKKGCTIVIILLAFLLQTTTFQSLALADVVPNLLLIVTVCYGYLRGRTSGLLTGFVCGLLLDMQFGTVVGLYAFIMMTLGFLVGFCRKMYFTDSLILPSVLLTASDLIYGIYCYVTEFLLRGKLNFGFAFVHKIFPEAIYTALVGILIYRILAWLEQILTARREEV